MKQQQPLRTSSVRQHWTVLAAMSLSRMFTGTEVLASWQGDAAVNPVERTLKRRGLGERPKTGGASRCGCLLSVRSLVSGKSCSQEGLPTYHHSTPGYLRAEKHRTRLMRLDNISRIVGYRTSKFRLRWPSGQVINLERRPDRMEGAVAIRWKV